MERVTSISPSGQSDEPLALRFRLAEISKSLYQSQMLVERLRQESASLRENLEDCRNRVYNAEARAIASEERADLVTAAFTKNPVAEGDSLFIVTLPFLRGKMLEAARIENERLSALLFHANKKTNLLERKIAEQEKDEYSDALALRKQVEELTILLNKRSLICEAHRKRANEAKEAELTMAKQLEEDTSASQHREELLDIEMNLLSVRVQESLEEIINLRGDLEEEQKKNIDLLDAHKELEACVDDLKLQLANVPYDVAEAEKRFKEHLRREKLFSSFEIDTLKEKVQKATESAAEYESLYNGVQVELEEVKKSTAEHKAIYDEQHEQLEKAIKLAAKHLKSSVNLKKNLERAEDKIAKLKKELSSFVETRKQMQRNLECAIQRGDKFKKYSYDLMDMNEDTKKKLEMSEQKAAEFQQQALENSENIEEAKKKLQGSEQPTMYFETLDENEQ